MPASEPAKVEPFPVRHVAQVAPRPKEATWLVEPLYGLAAAGVVAGAPKTCKTWLAAELALAVGTGLPALGRFPVRRTGPVLFFGAEDDQPALRTRFEALARARGARLEDAHVYLLDVAELRIDLREHVARLERTIERLSPVLVVLDPFVRIARVDENSATEVSAVLGSLRTIQRQNGTAILLAHHMRKSPAGHLGYQLRGSGDFAAWYDSGLYLARRDGDLVLTIEHRGAPTPPPIRLHLAEGADPHLAVVDAAPPAAAEEPDSLRAALLARLERSPRPVTTVELRDALHRRKQDVVVALEALARDGLVARERGGWVSPTVK
jgi:hypothetical protein